MTTQTVEQLVTKKCASCEDGATAYSSAEVSAQLKNLPSWRLTADGKRIRREWKMKDFLAGIDFFNAVAKVAEEEGHHPDLHLANYRDAAIELSTHAIGGLSENDFILAAKIDRVPVQLKK